MSSFVEIRAAIKARLDNVSSLRVSTYYPAQINCPAAIVAPVDWDFHQAMGSPGIGHARYDVIVLGAPVGSAGLERAQAALDLYLNDTGSFSIKEALEGDVTLNGTVSTINVIGVRDYGVMEVGEVPYMGCRFECEVWT